MAKHQLMRVAHSNPYGRAAELVRTGLMGLGLTLVLAACGNDNTSINAGDLGSLQVVNAVSDATTLTVLVEETELATLSFGQGSPIASVADGSFDVSVGFTGLDGNAVFLLEDESVRIRVEEQTFVVVAGTVAAPVILEFDLDNPEIATTASEVIILNTSGVPSVDAFLTAPGADLGAAVATTANNTVSPLIATEAGTRQLRITTGGNNDVIYDTGAFVLPGGERVILHVQPYFGPGEDSITATQISTSLTSNFPNQVLPVGIRVANAISDLPAVDASVEKNGSITPLNDLPSNELSQISEFTPGTAEIVVNVQTDPSMQLYSDSATLVGGEQRTLIAAGSFGNATTIARLAIDPQRPISTAAQLNVLQGSSSADRVDVYLLANGATITDSTPDIPNLALLANLNLEVLAGTYEVAITLNGQDTMLAGPVSIDLENNILYTILLTDADGGGMPPRIILGNNFE